MDKTQLNQKAEGLKSKRKRPYEKPKLTLKVPMETRTGSLCPS